MERSIQEVARLAGVSSRTLRHYDAVGLLPPSSTGAGGLRYYDRDDIVRLQRILLLRDLGLSLRAIAQVVTEHDDAARALRGHLDQLRADRRRLDRQIASVQRTLTALDNGEELMAEDMLDGFDHTQYREEVEERWGRDAYASGDQWWKSLGTEGQQEWKDRLNDLNEAWQAAAADRVDPGSERAQALAARHADWLSGIPGTPKDDDGRAAAEYLLGLGEMYVADERFAANYGGTRGATLVRDALRAYVDAQRDG